MGMTMLLTLLLVFVPCFPPDNFTKQVDLFCVYEDMMTKYSTAIRSIIDRSPATSLLAFKCDAGPRSYQCIAN
jgi:hypothetical protein